MKKTGLVALAAILLLFVGVFLGGETPRRPSFERTSLTILCANGTQRRFLAEVARTEEEQAYGLMFTSALADDAAMIFVYDTPDDVAFWMKNTLIPLDMLFVRADGVIARIVSQAQPQDLTPIPSQEPVSAVVEINGGLALKLGLAVGDRLETPVLKKLP